MSTNEARAGAPALGREVQEIVLICSLGFIIYLAMICCILCRRPPARAGILNRDVDGNTFAGRKPEDPEGYYFKDTSHEALIQAAGSLAGRIFVDRGYVTLRNTESNDCYLDRSSFGTFGPGEKFELLDGSDNLLYHLDLYTRLDETTAPEFKQD